MKYFSSLCVIAIVVAAAAWATAGQINVPAEFGLTARGIGMGNAMTAVADDTGLVYHNPAAMAAMTNSHFGFSYLFAKPNFQGGQKGELKEFTESNNILLNTLVLDLSRLLRSRRPFAAGLFVDFDRNGRQLMYFSDARFDDGRFYRYGRASTVGIASVALGVTDWLNIGGGVLAMQHSFVDYQYRTDLVGNSELEGIAREDRLNYSPILSLFLDFQSVDIGLTYRGENYSRVGEVTIESEATVGEADLTSIPISMQFQDSYAPQNIAVGVSLKPLDDLKISLDGTWYNWGRFDDQVAENDSPRQDVDLDFVDVYSPRLGLEYFLAKSLPLRAGYGYLPTPMRKPGSNRHIYLDNNRHVMSLGLGYLFTDLPPFELPLSLDVAFVHQYLTPSTYDSADDEATEFQSKGNLNGGIVSLTFRF